MEKWCFKHAPQKLIKLRVVTSEGQISIACSQFVPSETSAIAHLGTCRIDNQPCRGPVTGYVSRDDDPVDLWFYDPDLKIIE